MNIDRKQIEANLKEHVVPVLRESGFKGSFPNLYRDIDCFVSLINFQFFSSGGSFCINLSYATPDRENVYTGKEDEPRKLRVSQTKERVRLGAENLKGDHWFSFGATSYGEHRGEPTPISELVTNINHLFTNQAEPWWSKLCSR